jgi:hypothetical protein
VAAVLTPVAVLIGVGTTVWIVREKQPAAEFSTSAPTEQPLSPAPPVQSDTQSTPPDVTASNELPTPSVTAVGMVSLAPEASAQASADVASAAAEALNAYFSNIDAHRLGAAYAMYSPAEQAKNPYSQWSRNVAQSTIGDITIGQLSGGTSALGPDPVMAAASFTSHQPPALGPQPGEACTTWSLVYRLVPDDTGTRYLIDDAQSAAGNGHTPC